MRLSKSFRTLLIGMIIALVPVVLQAGCKGDLGWSRADDAVLRQSPADSQEFSRFKLVNSTSSERTDMAVHARAPVDDRGTATIR
jgi:hypothetical protein